MPGGRGRGRGGGGRVHVGIRNNIKLLEISFKNIEKKEHGPSFDVSVT